MEWFVCGDAEGEVFEEGPWRRGGRGDEELCGKGEGEEGREGAQFVGFGEGGLRI